MLILIGFLTEVIEPPVRHTRSGGEGFKPMVSLDNFQKNCSKVLLF